MARPALPPAKLLAVVAPVSIVGVGAYIAATLMFVARAHSATEITGVLAFLLASTFWLFASSAFAQFMGAGGFAPYSFNAPAAAAGSRGVDTQNSDASAAHCKTEMRGRSGAVYQCNPPPSQTPNK